MKKLFLLLTLISLFNISFAQTDSLIIGQNLPKEKLFINVRLEPYVEEFIAEGLERGFYLRGYLIKKFDYIKDFSLIR